MVGIYYTHGCILKFKAAKGLSRILLLTSSVIASDFGRIFVYFSLCHKYCCDWHSK